MKIFYMHIIWEPSIKRTTHEPFSGLWTTIGHKIYNSCKKKEKKGSTYIDKDGIDIIGAIVALKGCDVGPEIVGCNEKKYELGISVSLNSKL